MKEKKEYEWKFHKKNSKGEVVFRHETGQTLKDVVKFFKEKEIDIVVREGGNMVWVYFRGQKYSYYYTTGRWSPFLEGKYPNKHFHSKGVKDFHDRFLLKAKEKENGYSKEGDEAKEAWLEIFDVYDNSGDYVYYNGKPCVYMSDGLWISEDGFEHDDRS